MVAVSIMALVVGIASISIGNALRQARLREATRDLEGDISTIRTSARTHQRNVIAQVTANGIMAFYDMNNDGVYSVANDFFDQNGNLIYDAGVDVPGMLLEHAYTNGIQFDVTNSSGVGVVAPLTTIRFNEMGNISDADRVITVSLNSEPRRRYRILIYTTGSTRVLRSEDAGVTWPTRAW
jgi:Tfp pilus assembly protein FimT